MNFFQTTNNAANIELQALNRGLSEFGLHPQDWVLIKKTNDKVAIQHKEEPNFYFIGKTIYKNGQKIWNSIHLASL